jgi:hypothetical protein
LESHGGTHHVAPEVASEVKAQVEAKFHMYYLVVRMWYDICIDHVLRCFDNPERLSYGNLLVGVVPELSS